MFNKLVHYFLYHRLITILFLLTILVAGIAFAPFNWKTGLLPRNPISVDAIPDIGDNQQIIATEWMGRSPKDIQDQISYPLTSALLGIPGVRTIRSTSMFGMSFIYIIFKDNIEFYWSRTRILEKLNSLPSGTLPEGVKPALGPDATALGQVFWYTLEGQDPKTGKPAGGWNLQELRTIQDYQVKYALASSDGVSEVASIGGFVKEYQVNIDPHTLKAFNVSVMEVMNAVKNSNLDIAAETIELNKIEYVIRGLGYVKSLEDLQNSVVAVHNQVPVRLGDVAEITFGPATRRGGLDKAGNEAVGGVVVARYGSNPLNVINAVKNKIEQLDAALPQKILADGTVSKVHIVPFYDRTQLIHETIGTLESALTHEVLISILVIIILVMNLRASFIVGGLLPIGVLMTFIFMHFFGVEANIVALSGIAIAIGVMVDIGIVDVENILRHLEMPENKGIRGSKLMKVIYEATTEVRAAVVTSIATTIVSFLPVFAMMGAEGKMFHPLAFTKTFALLASFVLGIVVLPTLVHILFDIRININRIRKWFNLLLIAAGLILFGLFLQIPALALTAIGLSNYFAHNWSEKRKNYPNHIQLATTVLVALYYLTKEWLPLGAHNNLFVNLLFVIGLLSVILFVLISMVHHYEPILRWALNNKKKFLLLPLTTLCLGVLVWSGVGKEFMPTLNEGSFLLMPTSMPHTGIEQNIEYTALLDKRIAAIPEVETSVGKWGRVNSPLDPAPIQMFENTINYRSEYILDENGQRMRFKVNNDGAFKLKNGGFYQQTKEDFRVLTADRLIPFSRGEYYRQWRPNIRKPDDIWQEIVKVTDLPGLTAAPKLQPIETRLVMLSTGMRASMGLKVFGPDLQSIEEAGLAIEQALKHVPSIKTASVFYDRTVGAPYLEIKLNRLAMARYGLSINEVQSVLQMALGGMPISTAVEGRERIPIRVRYARELRDNPEDIGNLLIATATNAQIPLKEIADIQYTKGAQMIRSEDTFLVGYVVFDKKDNKAEVDVVKEADRTLKKALSNGSFSLPTGVHYAFTGNYENEIRATKRLALVIPISLVLILLLLYLQFKTTTASFIHFSGVFVAFAGGFIFMWLYGQGWFMNFSVAGINMRDLFQMHTIYLSVAVWVGFIALFGIATNDGVIMGTYIHQVFEKMQPATVHDVREAVIIAGKKRVRPAMMTTAVAIIALLPVLSSTGKGSDVMIPMSIPAFGGMAFQVMTVFVVPVLQAIWRENAVRTALKKELKSNSNTKE